MSYWTRLDLRALLTRRRWAKPLLATLAGTVIAYLLALHFLFPYGELKRWTESQLRSAGLEARLDGLGPGLVFGLKASSVQIAPVGAPERATEFRDVRVTMSFLSLLTFRPRVLLEAQAMGGAVDARWALGKQRGLTLRWTGVDLGRAPFPASFATLGLRGRSTGALDAQLPSPELPGSRLSGTLAATITQARLGPGTLGGFPLPGVPLGSGQFQFKADRGRVAVQAARFEGGELDASFTGTLDVPPDGSRIGVDGTIRLLPRGKAADDLGFLLAFLPSARRSDGSYLSRLGGRVGSLVLSPATGP